MNSFCFLNTVNEWGGGEKWHLEMASYLHAKGHAVLVIAQPDSVLSKRASAVGITVHSVKLSNLSILNPFFINSLVSVLKKQRVESIVLNLSRDLKCGGVAAKIAGVENIIFRRGSDRPVRNYFINRLLYQKVISHVLTNSQATKNAILSNGVSLVSPDKIRVIPNGIDTAAYINKSYNPVKDKKDSVFTIAALGRLVAQKNFEFLIPVALSLKKRGITFRILIGGEGAQEEQLKSMVTENNLEKEIEFLGFLDNPKDLLMSADIFLLPSLWEGFGYVLAEASLCTLPVVAFDISSNGEVVDKSSGFLTPPHQVKPFCDKIEYLFLNPEKRIEMGKAGQEFVKKNFEASQIFERIETYLKPGN